MGEVYCFQYRELRLVLDIESNCLHLVDEPAFEAINYLNGRYNWDDCQEELRRRWGDSEVKGVMQELHSLAAEGMLFSEPLLPPQVGAAKQIKALCLHAAHACNLRCRYCFAGAGSFGGDCSLMSPEVGKAAIDFLFQAAGTRQHCEIDFFGGEPLLNFPVIKEIVDYGQCRAVAQNKQVQFTLTTNALLNDEHVIQFLQRNDMQAILSLDGRPEVHDRMRPDNKGSGTYARAMAGTKRFLSKSNGDNYYIRGTFTAHNIDFSKDVAHLLREGYRRISVEPVVASPEEDYALRMEHVPNLVKEYDKLVDLYLHYIQQGDPFDFFHFQIDLDNGPCLQKRLSGCGAGTEYLAVTPQGDIYPCHQFVGLSRFLMGNVMRKESFHHLPAYLFPEAGPLRGECRDCWARYHCGGGCRANAYYVNGDVRRPYAMGCTLQKKRLECALYLQAKLALDEKDSFA